MEKQSAEYSGSMYTFLYGMQQFEKMGYNMQHHGRENENDNVAKALIETRHQPLIKMILDFEHDKHRSFCEAIMAYNDNKEHETLVEVLLEYNEKHNSLRFRELIKELAALPDNDELIKKYAQYAAMDDGDSYSTSDNLFYIREMARILFEAGRNDLAMEIVKTHLTDKEFPFMEILSKLYKNEKVTSEEITEAFNTNMPLATKKNRGDYFSRRKKENAVKYFTRHLIDSGVSLDLIEAGIREYEARHAMDQIEYLDDSWNIKLKIVRDKLSRDDFDGAEEFIESCDLSYGRSEVFEAKLQHLVQHKDGEGHKIHLSKALAVLEERIAQQIENEEVKDESEMSQLKNWHTRPDYFELKAKVEAEKAIFEHMHGDPEKTQKYVAQIIHWINQMIVVPDGKECKPQHMKTFKKQKYNAKRSLRTKFNTLGLLHILPQLEGWCDKIGATEAEREESRRKSKHHAKKGEYIDFTKEEYAEEARKREAPFIQKIKDALEKGVDEAVEVLGKMVTWKAGTEEWKRGELILDAAPEKFKELFEILSKKSFDRSGFDIGYREEHGNLSEFVLKGIDYGVADVEFIDELIDKWYQSCWTPDGKRPIPYHGITTLIEGLLDKGQLSLAIAVFKNDKVQEYMARNTLVKCIAIFIRHASKNIDDVRCGAKFAFKDGELPKDATAQEQTEYWNSEIERMISTKGLEGYEIAMNELMSQMDDVGSVRSLVRLMALGSMRTPHQKKDTLLSAYKRQKDEPECRYEIVGSLIDNKIPGAVSLPEIKSKNTPFKVAAGFFMKLVETEVLHKHTLQYLNEDDMPYLRSLLSQYQNQFNTIMETMEKGLRFKTEKKISSLEWKRILLVLQEVGVLTPGIYAEAEACGFDKKELLEIKKKMDSIKEKMFTNQNMDEEDITPELMAESIYIAFQPANMGLSTVQDLCERVPDCSHHLDQYNFPIQGYPLDLKTNKTMKIRRGAVIETPPRIYNPKKLKDKLLMPDHRRKQIRALCDLGNFKMDNVDLSDVLVAFKNNGFFREAMKEWKEAQSDDQQYRALRRLQETLGIFLEDNLEAAMGDFIKKRMEFASKMIKSFVKGLKKKGKRQALKNQLGLEINGENDIELAAKVITKVFLQKYKPLAEIKGRINKDSKKFLTADGEEIADTDLRLRAVVSKNKASFFAKASAGICTASNVGLFNREDHFHINLVDEDEKRCVGNVQAYIMPYQGKNYLLMRGFNPSTKILKEVDVDSLCEALIDVGRQFVHDNKLEGVMVSEQGGFLALSNRPEVKDYVERTYRDHSIEIPAFEISNGYEIKHAYIVDDKPKQAFQPREFDYVEEMLIGESMVG